MSKEPKNKQRVSIVLIIVIITVVVLAGVGIYKLVTRDDWHNAKTVDEIVINADDSDEVKLEKLQAKVDLINKDINSLQEKLNIELDTMNELYKEYVQVMNEYQTGATTE